MRTLSPQTEEKFVSTAMRLINRGRAEGKLESFDEIAFTMLKKHYADEDILDLTGMSKQRLEYLKTLKTYKFE